MNGYFNLGQKPWYLLPSYLTLFYVLWHGGHRRVVSGAVWRAEVSAHLCQTQGELEFPVKGIGCCEWRLSCRPCAGVRLWIVCTHPFFTHVPVNHPTLGGTVPLFDAQNKHFPTFYDLQIATILVSCEHFASNCRMSHFLTDRLTRTYECRSTA